MKGDYKTNTNYTVPAVIVGIHHRRKWYQHYMVLANVLVVIVAGVIIVSLILITHTDTIVVLDGYLFVSDRMTESQLQHSLMEVTDPISYPSKEEKIYSGYIPNIKVVKNHGYPQIARYDYVDILAPEGTFPYESETSIAWEMDEVHYDTMQATDTDLYLPPRKMMWEYVAHTLPHKTIIDKRRLKIQPRLKLAEIYIPDEKIRLLRDTAFVEGYLILHKTGRVSLVDVYESQLGKAFADDIRNALRYSFCYPAKDTDGNTIDIKVKYQCVIFKGGKAVTNIIPNDESYEKNTNQYELVVVK